MIFCDLRDYWTNHFSEYKGCFSPVLSPYMKGWQVFCCRFVMQHIILTTWRVKTAYALLFHFEAHKWGKCRIKNELWVQVATKPPFCVNFVSSIRVSTVSLELKSKFRLLHRHVFTFDILSLLLDYDVRVLCSGFAFKRLSIASTIGRE